MNVLCVWYGQGMRSRDLLFALLSIEKSSGNITHRLGRLVSLDGLWFRFLSSSMLLITEKITDY